MPMKILILALLLVHCATAMPPSGDYVRSGDLLIPKSGYASHATSPEPKDYISDDELPEECDYRWLNGTNFTPLLRNQHNPGLTEDNYCGSCWAVSTANALETRWKVMHQGENVPDFQLSIQDVINCGNSGSCEGGDNYGVLQYGQKVGFVDETCNSYLGRDETCNKGYIGSRCYTCNRQWTPHCQAVPLYKKYYVDEMGEVSGEQDMMKEIYARGPIVAAIHDPPSLKAWNATDENPVYTDPSGETAASHNVAVVGYGVTDKGIKYWVIMNSWGTSWNMHDNGFFLLIRGINNLGIESNGCTWGTMKPDVEYSD